VSSHELKSLQLKLKPTVKIIDIVKKVSPRTYLIAFRAEYKLPRKKLIESAHRRLLEARADLVVVNDVGKKEVGFGAETNEVFIVDKEKNAVHVPLAVKREIARKILDVAIGRIRPK
jgi:phosphopantothenoylcysteine decarboxylase/phosphopantothenate--cysteine ligase